MTEKDSVVCHRGPCDVMDIECLHNKTMTISWQFLQLPSLEFIRAPVTIVNIRTTGYSIYPNLSLRITHGNEDGYFQTSVMGDKAALMLIKPLKGPAEKRLTMTLENWDIMADYVISRHVTHVYVMVQGVLYTGV